MKIYIFDLSKRVLATEKCNEMTENIRSKSKARSLCKVMAGNSSKALPMNPCEVNLHTKTKCEFKIDSMMK
jgi:hypothetical protein